MTIDDLKMMLEEGKITQENFDEMKKLFELVKPEPCPEPKKGISTLDDKHNKNLQSKVEDMLQREIDRITNKLGNDNKGLREENKRLNDELKKMKRANMSIEQLKNEELREQEAELEERERALRDKENRLYAISELKKAGLDDGSDTSLEIINFVMDDDTSVIDTKIKSFNDLIKNLVQIEVDKTFKGNGRNPQRGNSGSNPNNPYARETFNLSEQMRLESENPELAKQLQTLAGVSK